MHNGYIFILHGEMLFTMNGQKYLGNDKHVIMAPKAGNYDFVVNNDAVCIIIDFELNSGFFEEMYIFEINEPNTFYQNFVMMEKWQVFNLSSHELMCLSVLYDITARINGYGMHSEKYKAIEKGEQFLEENLDDCNLSVSQAAEASNISEVYFRKLFKEKHNVSPYQYINDARINRSKRLLLNDGENISDIAAACGFSSVYCFSRSFKKAVGLSPSQFKKKYTVSD